MTRRGKISFAIFVGVVFLCAGVVTGFALSLHAMGTIVVDVREHGARGGDDISIHIPGALAKAALMVVPNVAFDGVGPRMRKHLPAAREACRALAQAPDFVLVEMASRDGAVRISKEGNELIIVTDSPGQTIHVRVPVKLALTVMNRVGRGACKI